MRKFYTAKYDIIFKNALCTDNNKDLLKWFLEKILNIEIKFLVIKTPEIPKRNILIKNKTLDVLIETKYEKINLELNSNYYDSLPKRNFAYLCSNYSEEINKGEDYSIMKNHIQINFTWKLSQEHPVESIYEMYDKTSKNRYVKNFKIIEYNMDKLIRL